MDSIEEAAHAAASSVITTVASQTSEPTSVRVLVYSATDHDPAWTGCATRDDHMRLLRRIAELVAPSQITLALTPYDRDSYAKWLGERLDSKARRSEWASDSAGTRYAFKIGGRATGKDMQPVGPIGIGWAVYRLAPDGEITDSGEEYL